MLRTQCIPHRLLAGMLAAVVLAEVTEAAVQTIARWRGGEDDLPAPSGAFGPANNTAQDGTGRRHPGRGVAEPAGQRLIPIQR